MATWEKDVCPDDLPAVKPRTAKALRQLIDSPVVAAYDPPAYTAEALATLTEPQTIDVWYNWFLMSGVGWLSTRGPTFRGYLSSFTPSGFESGDGAEMTITITPEA